MNVGLATLIIVVPVVVCHVPKHMRSPPNADVRGVVEFGGSGIVEGPWKTLCAAMEPEPSLTVADLIDASVRGRGGKEGP